MRILVLLCAIFTSISSISQKKIYTQKDIDSFSLRNPTPEKLSKFKSMLESNNDLVCWMFYYKQKCYYHLIKKENDSVLFYGRKGLEYFKSKDLPPEKFKIEERYLKAHYLYMAMVLRWQKQYNLSTDYLLKAKALIAKYPNFKTTNHPFIYSYLAGNYLFMGDKKEALKYRLMASKDSIYMKNPRDAAFTFHRLGVLYELNSKKDSVLYWYRKGVNECKKKGDYEMIGSTYNNIGDFYRKENNVDSAIFYYKKSNNLLLKFPDYDYGAGKYFTMSNYAYVLLHEGDTKNAIKNLRIVLDSIKHIDKIDDDIKNLKTTTFDYLIEAYQKTYQLDKAIEILKQKNELLEKYHQQVLDEKLRELNIAYEVKEKDASIKELQTTTKAQSIIIKQSYLMSIVLGILLFALIGIGILILRQRKLKNKYETTNLEQRLLRSQLNPHFIFNALSTVGSLANKNSEKTTPYIAKLSSLIRLVLKNSREEFVSLEDELKCIDDYLELQSNFSQKFSYIIKIDPTIDIENTFIPPMFIQPFIENSIAHGFKEIEKGKIDIDIQINEKNRLIECRILDNGIGVKNALEFKNKNGVEYESFSGKILKERLQIYSKSLNKKAKFTTKALTKEKGTEVNISLPYILE